MENQVTLDRREYDYLQECKRELATMNERFENDEPIIVSATDRWGESSFNVFSGKKKVEDFFSQHNAAVKDLKAELKTLEDRYKKQSAFLAVMKEFFKY